MGICSVTKLKETTDSTPGNIDLLKDKLALLERKIDDLNKTNVVSVVAESGSNFNQPDADMVLTKGNIPLTGKVTVTGKSIDVKSLAADSSAVKFTATENVNITGVDFTGTLIKTVSNAQLSVNTPNYVNITASTFNQAGYNAIEVGLETPVKSVIIDGINFTNKLTNNAISIFKWEDDAIITVSNCTFKSVSNVVRISNGLNKRATINFINCKAESWETGEYAGFLCMQDYTSTSATLEKENKLFSKDKLTINFTNCYGPYGKIEEPKDYKTTFGSKLSAYQLGYVYGSKTNEIYPYVDGEFYPTFTFK